MIYETYLIHLPVDSIQSFENQMNTQQTVRFNFNIWFILPILKQFAQFTQLLQLISAGLIPKVVIVKKSNIKPYNPLNDFVLLLYYCVNKGTSARE